MKPTKEKKPPTDRDEGMAVAFEDMMAHRDVLQILKRYGAGYVVEMSRNFRPYMGWVRKSGPYYHTDVPEKDAAPAYFVHIKKYKSKAELKKLGNIGDLYDVCFEWRADAHARTFLAALQQADREAQHILQRRAERE